MEEPDKKLSNDLVLQRLAIAFLAVVYIFIFLKILFL